MTATPTKTNMVRIRLNRDCLIAGEFHKAGKEMEVSEPEAAEFCKTFKTLPDYDGERNKPSFHSLQRATRL